MDENVIKTELENIRLSLCRISAEFGGSKPIIHTPFGDYDPNPIDYSVFVNKEGTLYWQIINQYNGKVEDYVKYIKQTAGITSNAPEVVAFKADWPQFFR